VLGTDQDRHLMMPSSPIHHRTETYHSGRLSTGGARPPNTSPAALRSALASLPAIRHDEGRRHDRGIIGADARPHWREPAPR
jgi:hypothetical protein